MRKGITFSTIAALVLAVIALTLLSIFLLKLSPQLSQAVENMIHGFKCWMCKTMGWWSLIFCAGLKC
jgi:hypothetical protein